MIKFARRHLSPLCSLFVLVLSGYMMGYVGTATANTEKSYFFFNGEFSNIKIRITVNGIPVFNDTTEQVSGIAAQFNQALVANQNSIDIFVSPVKGQANFSADSSIELEIYRASSPSGTSGKESLKHLVVNDLAKQKPGQLKSFTVAGKADSLVFSTDIDAGKLFPRWSWQDGQNISKNSKNYTSLLEEYQKIHNLLKENKSIELEQKLTTKIRDYQRYFFTESIDKAKSRVSYNDVLTDKSAKLIPLWTKNMQLEVFAGGKLARIADTEGDSPIVFLLGENQSAAYVVKLVFMKSKNGEWIVVR